MPTCERSTNTHCDYYNILLSTSVYIYNIFVEGIPRILALLDSNFRNYTFIYIYLYNSYFLRYTVIQLTLD